MDKTSDSGNDNPELIAQISSKQLKFLQAFTHNDQNLSIEGSNGFLKRIT